MLKKVRTSIRMSSLLGSTTTTVATKDGAAEASEPFHHGRRFSLVTTTSVSSTLSKPRRAIAFGSAAPPADITSFAALASSTCSSRTDMLASVKSISGVAVAAPSKKMNTGRRLSLAATISGEAAAPKEPRRASMFGSSTAANAVQPALVSSARATAARNDSAAAAPRTNTTRSGRRRLSLVTTAAPRTDGANKTRRSSMLGGYFGSSAPDNCPAPASEPQFRPSSRALGLADATPSEPFAVSAASSKVGRRFSLVNTAATIKSNEQPEKTTARPRRSSMLGGYFGSNGGGDSATDQAAICSTSQEKALNKIPSGRTRSPLVTPAKSQKKKKPLRRVKKKLAAALKLSESLVSGGLLSGSSHGTESGSSSEAKKFVQAASVNEDSDDMLSQFMRVINDAEAAPTAAADVDNQVPKTTQDSHPVTEEQSVELSCSSNHSVKKETTKSRRHSSLATEERRSQDDDALLRARKQAPQQEHTARARVDASGRREMLMKSKSMSALGSFEGAEAADVDAPSRHCDRRRSRTPATPLPKATKDILESYADIVGDSHDDYHEGTSSRPSRSSTRASSNKKRNSRSKSREGRSPRRASVDTTSAAYAGRVGFQSCSPRRSSRRASIQTTTIAFSGSITRQSKAASDTASATSSSSLLTEQAAPEPSADDAAAAYPNHASSSNLSSATKDMLEKYASIFQDDSDFLESFDPQKRRLRAQTWSDPSHRSQSPHKLTC